MTRLQTFIAIAFVLGTAAPSYAQIAGDIRVDPKKAWSTLDGVEQYALLRNVQFSTRSTVNYIADALDDKLTALGRFGYVGRCLDGNDSTVVDWAICQPDIDALDPAKVVAEIDADQAHAGDHAGLKAALDALRPELAERATKVKAAIDKDDAYKKMFEIAAQVRRDAKGGGLRDLALALDDARVTHSRKALAGCEDKVWPAWVSAVSAIPAKSFSLVYKDFATQVHDNEAATVVGTPDGYLAAVALTSCFKKDQLVSYVRRALFFWPGFRGPRDAAQLAMMQAGLELDDRDEKLTWPSIDRRELLTGDNNAGIEGSNGAGRAPLVSLTPAGDKTHVVFGPTKTKGVKCVDYRAGKHLSRIEPDGRLVYEGTCYKYVDIVITSSPPKPIDTRAKYTTGMKPGMYAGFVDDALLDATAGPAAKVPSVVFGAPVR